MDIKTAHDDDTAIDVSKLTSDLSHEMRTVLGGVIGINELLLTSQLDPHQRTLAQVLEQSTRILLAALDDTVTLSRLMQNNLKIDSAPFDIRAVIAETTDHLGFLMEGKGIVLSLKIDAMPQLVLADRARVKQIIHALILRLVNVLEKTTVEIAASFSNTKANAGEFHFSISGGPIGQFDEQHLSTLTEPIRPGRRYESSWLALYLCYRLTTLMNGACGSVLESKHCKLWITLPMQMPST